jgi:hypothetical protein
MWASFVVQPGAAQYKLCFLAISTFTSAKPGYHECKQELKRPVNPHKNPQQLHSGLRIVKSYSVEKA